jgi:hypothetical protein
MRTFSPLEWFAQVGTMACKSCGASNQMNFTGEIAIHFPGLNNIDKPAVFVFPEILFCTNCGYAEFAVPENQMRLLANGGAGSSCEEQLPNFLSG